MGSLGAPELLIILAIVLLLFGSTRLPKMARSLGQASKEFKRGVTHGDEDADSAGGDDDTSGAAAETETETVKADVGTDAAGNGSGGSEAAEKPSSDAKG